MNILETNNKIQSQQRNRRYMKESKRNYRTENYSLQNKDTMSQ